MPLTFAVMLSLYTCGRVPVIMTVFPRQLRVKRGEEVEERQAKDDVVIDGDHEGRYDHGVANALKEEKKKHILFHYLI